MKPPYCQKCGRPVRKAGLCRVCERYSKPYARQRAAGIYDGVLKEAVKSLKYRGRTAVSDKLGRMMASTALADGEMCRVELVLPVPLHRVRRRERGFNQAELLARVISRELSLPVLTGSLVRTRYTRQQTSLSRKKRRTNVKGAFRVIHPDRIEGKRILLVDDVTTTGATIEECASALMDAGALEVYCLTAAIALT